MILDIITLLVALLFIAIGLRRGVWLSALHFTSNIFSLWIAALFYRALADRLVLFLPFPKTVAYDMTYYLPFNHVHERFQAMVAFLSIALVTKLLCYVFILMADRLVYLKYMGVLSRTCGALLGIISAMMVLSMLYYTIALYPNEAIQGMLRHSFLSDNLILHTPWLSTFMTQLY